VQEADSRRALIAVARGERLDPALVTEALVAAAEREGLLGLLARATNGGPRSLRVRATALEARNAIMLAELQRIAAAFVDVKLLVFKGPLLSQQLYGDPHLRDFSDLDLLVAPEDVDRAIAILAALGYRDPEPVPRDKLALHRRSNNASILVHDAKRIVVDLHWRFTPAHLPPDLSFSEVWSRRATALGMQTLGAEDLALLVATHAAKHLWNKLELFAQIHALGRGRVDWHVLDELATRTRVQRQVGLSFVLAGEILGTPLPPLERSLAAAAPVIANVRKLAATKKPDASGRDHFLLLDRRRDAWRALAVAALVPTHADWGERTSRGAWVRRPFRLLTKYLRKWLE
jgi:hypothetical protein